MSFELKQQMFEAGKLLMERFCALNGLPCPTFELVDKVEFGVCAYYRKHKITMSIRQCAAIGTVGRQWSYPGYTVDRTPYGVIQHELGHHTDWFKSDAKGAYFGDFSVMMRKEVNEAPITSYCPNDAEWFAEIFRVFVTNPDLLRCVRPKAHAFLAERFVPAFNDDWENRLYGGPQRMFDAVKRRIKE